MKAHWLCILTVERLEWSRPLCERVEEHCTEQAVQMVCTYCRKAGESRPLCDKVEVEVH